jgi:hypothetical protein
MKYYISTDESLLCKYDGKHWYVLYRYNRFNSNDRWIYYPYNDTLKKYIAKGEIYEVTEGDIMLELI